MSIFDKFKSKHTGEKKSAKEDSVLDMVKEPVVEKVLQKSKEDTGSAHRILKNYHLSEKSNLYSSQGRYIFKVATNANKIEIRKAVEAVYDVHVTAVNTINNPGKSRRMGRTVGRTPDWKKAIVTLKTGEKITGLAEGV